MRDVVVWIIIGLFFAVGSIVKRAMEAAAEKERQRPKEDREFGASPDQVGEFLEEVRRGRQAAVPVEEYPAAPAEMVQPVMPTRPVEPPPTPAPQAKPRRAKKGKKTSASEPALTSAQPSAPPAAPAAPVAPVAFRLADTDLKKAIVWSERVGRPVSMRKRIGHRPPTPGR